MQQLSVSCCIPRCAAAFLFENTDALPESESRISREITGFSHENRTCTSQLG